MSLAQLEKDLKTSWLLWNIMGTVAAVFFLGHVNGKGIGLDITMIFFFIGNSVLFQTKRLSVHCFIFFFDISYLAACAYSLKSSYHYGRMCIVLSNIIFGLIVYLVSAISLSDNWTDSPRSNAYRINEAALDLDNSLPPTYEEAIRMPSIASPTRSYFTGIIRRLSMVNHGTSIPLESIVTANNTSENVAATNANASASNDDVNIVIVADNNVAENAVAGANGDANTGKENGEEGEGEHSNREASNPTNINIESNEDNSEVAVIVVEVDEAKGDAIEKQATEEVGDEVADIEQGITNLGFEEGDVEGNTNLGYEEGEEKKIAVEGEEKMNTEEKGDDEAEGDRDEQITGGTKGDSNVVAAGGASVTTPVDN